MSLITANATPNGYGHQPNESHSRMSHLLEQSRNMKDCLTTQKIWGEPVHDYYFFFFSGQDCGNIEITKFKIGR